MIIPLLLGGAAVAGALLSAHVLGTPDPRNPGALRDPFRGKGWIVAVIAFAAGALILYMLLRRGGWA